MSKTPVSVLQEYAAKRSKGVPEYTILNNNSGTHENEFTYKVKYNSLVAYGTASSKKEAKQKGAKGMLELLSDPFYATTGNVNSETFKVDSHHLPSAPDVSQKAIFVNSVGKLSEFCTIHKLKTPDYSMFDSSGPHHAMSFTITCSIGKLEATATSSTKKQAKHDAAQAMLDKLVRNTNYKVTHDMAMENKRVENPDDLVRKFDLLDLQIEDPSMSVIAGAEKAKKLYPALRTYRGTVKVANTINVKDFHEALKNSIEPNVRLSIRDYIHQNSVAKEKVLDHVVKLLDLSVESEILLNTRDHVIVTYSLDSKPVIVDTGVGDTFAKAKEQAITNLLNTIDLLLS